VVGPDRRAITTDRHVQNEEERVIEHPSARQILRVTALYSVSSYVPSNRARAPLDA